MEQNKLDKILDNHKLWLSAKGGDRANLYGAELDFKIYQFYLGKFNAVATEKYLRIGCQVHNWDIWDKEYKQIGRDASFTEEEIRLHRKQMKVIAKELKVGKYKPKTEAE